MEYCSAAVPCLTPRSPALASFCTIAPGFDGNLPKLALRFHLGAPCGDTRRRPSCPGLGSFRAIPLWGDSPCRSAALARSLRASGIGFVLRSCPRLRPGSAEIGFAFSSWGPPEARPGGPHPTPVWVRFAPSPPRPEGSAQGAVSVGPTIRYRLLTAVSGHGAALGMDDMRKDIECPFF
jgi:hypothetical protein